MPICAVFGTQSVPPDATRSPGHGTHSGTPVDVSRTSLAAQSLSVMRSIGVNGLSCQVML
eukprot:7384523-Prymnesium_polylepis.1